jgi:hypothetical protein
MPLGSGTALHGRAIRRCPRLTAIDRQLREDAKEAEIINWPEGNDWMTLANDAWGLSDHHTRRQRSAGNVQLQHRCRRTACRECRSAGDSTSRCRAWTGPLRGAYDVGLHQRTERVNLNSTPVAAADRSS